MLLPLSGHVNRGTGIRTLPAVNRYQTGLDPRMAAAMAGGVLGIALVALLFMVRPHTSSASLGNPAYPIASYQPPPFEVMGPEGLAAAYQHLGRVTIGGRPGTLSVSRADDLVLPTGRVGAGDAFFVDAEPFTTMLPAGSHPVFLLNVLEAGGQSVAAAMVRVEDKHPVRWEGASVRSHPKDVPFAYPVDSGTGSFVSPEAIARFESLPPEIADSLIDRLLEGYASTPETTFTVSITLDPASGANLVTFTSGYGDGGYPSWFGFDASGNPVALLTSFDLIDESSGQRRRGASPWPSEGE